MFRYAVAFSLAFVVCFLCGCGYMGGTQPVDTVDLKEALAEQGLIVSVEADKGTYAVGEPVHYWLLVQNNGGRFHELALHPLSNEQATVTYGGYVVPSIGGVPSGALWSVWENDPLTKTIQPGESVRLVEFTWNQKTNAGVQVDPGEYYLRASVEHIYLDGHRISDSSLWTLDPCRIEVTGTPQQ